MNKGEQRTHFKNILRQHSAEAQPTSEHQQRLVQNLLKFLKSFSGTWGGYQPLPYEASMVAVAEHRKDIRWVYPRMHRAELQFCLPEIWEKADFGVLQPAQGCEQVALSGVQGMLIPGLAFDKWGNRLGRGKGFYDKALQGFQGVKVGVGYSWQVSQGELPTESHDVKMNWIITEDSILKI